MKIDIDKFLEDPGVSPSEKDLEGLWGKVPEVSKYFGVPPAHVGPSSKISPEDEQKLSRLLAEQESLSSMALSPRREKNWERMNAENKLINQREVEEKRSEPFQLLKWEEGKSGRVFYMLTPPAHTWVCKLVGRHIEFRWREDPPEKWVDDLGLTGKVRLEIIPVKG